jgi:hypothetical protein
MGIISWLLRMKLNCEKSTTIALSLLFLDKKISKYLSYRQAGIVQKIISRCCPLLPSFSEVFAGQEC